MRQHIYWFRCSQMSKKGYICIAGRHLSRMRIITKIPSGKTHSQIKKEKHKASKVFTFTLFSNCYYCCLFYCCVLLLFFYFFRYFYIYITCSFRYKYYFIFFLNLILYDFVCLMGVTKNLVYWLDLKVLLLLVVVAKLMQKRKSKWCYKGLHYKYKIF